MVLPTRIYHSHLLNATPNTDAYFFFITEGTVGPQSPPFTSL